MPRSLLLILLAVSALHAQTRPIRALVITGGHDYETGFYTLFEGYDDLKLDRAVHRIAADAYTPDMQKKYDVLVLYDMPQEITGQQKQNLMDFAQAGRGIVVLHHAICSLPDWPQYHEMIGGEYFVKPEGEHAASTYQHDVVMQVTVLDRKHPITQGIADFEINDEAYGGVWVSPEAHLLLTTGHPKASKALAWISPEPRTRVVTILLGHGEGAYTNANFRRLLIQAIRWASGQTAR